MSLQVESYHTFAANDLEEWPYMNENPDYPDRKITSKVPSSLKRPKQSVLNTNSQRVNFFQACLYSCVLEDVIVQLRMLDECNNGLRVTMIQAKMDALLRNKFSVLEPKSVDELATIDPNNLSCGLYKLEKLTADRNYVRDVFTHNYRELSLNNNFFLLETFCSHITQKETYYNFLIEDVANNKSIRHETHKQLRQQRNHIKSLVYDADVAIDALKSKVEDSVLLSETRKRYVQNWQNARSEQHRQVIEDSESVPSTIISYYKRRQDHEERVHAEVETLTQIFITETLKKVEDWMNKYDNDMENIDLKIQIKKNDYQVTLEKRIALEAKLEKHDIMMKEWIHFKEEREKARQYVDKMTKSAVTVQAWWRGLLVRLKLGPYKETKKGRGKKK